MSDLTDVRKTMGKEAREQEKRAARQSEAYKRNENIDVNKLAGKDPEQRRGHGETSARNNRA